MLPVGLLPGLGATFGVPNSATGLLVSLYAVMVAALAVPLTVATTRFARKPLLLTTLAGYAVSNALVAAAPAFAVVAVGRTVGGVTHALFFSLVIGYAPRLVSRAHVGRALALAAVARRPVGPRRTLLTSLGTAAGWRVSFAVLAALSILTFILVSRLLPAVQAEPVSRRSERGGRGPLIAVATSNMLVFLGQFTAYTFISLLLLTSGVVPAFVGPILLACGACRLLGCGTRPGATETRDGRRCRLAVMIRTVVVLTAPGRLAAVIVATAVWSAGFGGVPRSTKRARSAHAMPLNAPVCLDQCHRQRGHRGRSGHRQAAQTAGCGRYRGLARR
jgi:predicted MFS family arabinose efflux permease